jgi:hypothetical protein
MVRNRWVLVGFVVAAAVWLAGASHPWRARAALAQGEFLQLAGTAALDSVALDGGEKFSLQLGIRNLAAEPAQIRRADFFLASEGGWAWSLGDLIRKDGGFFGAGPQLGPRAQIALGRQQFEWSAPVSHAVFHLQAVGAGGKTQELLAQFPIRRTGYALPANLPARGPVFIGIQEPVEALPLSTGEKWLPVIGQIVNWGSEPLTLTRWRLRLEGPDGAMILDRDLAQSFVVRNSREPVTPFLYGFVLPAGFARGRLTLGGEASLPGGRQALERSAPVSLATVQDLQPPVSGLWKWGNGPGELVMHTHYGFPEQRYAYDLVMLGDAGGQRRPFRVDPGSNESYFAWDQPIFCMADGRVAEVIDDVPDNFGNRENPANNPKRNSHVIVQHPGNRFSIYSHLRQGSAVVRVGQQVKAGERLGRVGNAGFSSEPHLHAGSFEIDATGRVRALPMGFRNLQTAAGAPVAGVPQGGREYRSK